MRRFLWIALVALVASCGTAGKIKRLSPVELDTYHALEVYMTEDEEKAYLKLKTEAERTEWLQSHGGNELGYGPKSYWEMYDQFDDAMKKKISVGDVQVGWPEVALFMAWGRPFKEAKIAGRKAQRSVLYEYRMELHEGGQAIVWVPDSKTAYKAINYFRYEVIVDDGVVSEMTKKDGWK
jgi:hypothetical protein